MQQHTVMIIDDSPLERFIAETIIKRTLPAHQIISFTSGFTALDHLQLLSTDETPFPRVVLLDIYMPIMNGFAFLNKYLEFPTAAREQTRIVIFSSTENAEDHAMMRTYPQIYKFIRKPLSDEVIKEISGLWISGKNEI